MKVQGASRDATGRETQSSGRIRERVNYLAKSCLRVWKIDFDRKVCTKVFLSLQRIVFFFWLIETAGRIIQLNSFSIFRGTSLPYWSTRYIVGEKETTHVIFFARMSLLLVLLFHDNYSWPQKGRRIVFLLFYLPANDSSFILVSSRGFSRRETRRGIFCNF